MANSTRTGSTPSRNSVTLETTVLRTEPGIYSYSAWRNISIGVWVGRATLPAVQAIFAVGATMERQHPDGRSSIVFVLDQVPAPTPDAQAEMARLYEMPGLVCTAIVLEGSGFWASGIRSMASNVHRSATVSGLLRVQTSIDEVASWFPTEHRRRTGVNVSQEDLSRVLATVRVEAAERARSAP
jgi:hypothetical protein